LKVSAIKRKFIDEFAQGKKLTSFQKKRLSLEIGTIRADYELGLKFTKYIKENQADIETFINDLDTDNQIVVKTILTNLKFISTHTSIETVQKFIMRGYEVLEQLNTIESIKNKYKLPLDMYEESIFKYKHGLKFVPQNILNSLNNKDFLDCGAYIGESALIFESEYKPNKIYSFEPVTENYNLLLETIKINNLQKIIPIDKGVGEKSRTVNFHSRGISSYISEDGNTEMELISIDEFVKEKNLSVGMIKMDVEGYELEVLKGAKETIQEVKPVLLIGIYHNPEEFFSAIKYVKEISNEYEIKIKHLADIRPLAEIHLIAW
jgi:FkbM family methyltransferase